MNILYLSYWGAKEGLTQATVVPRLKVLSQMVEVDKIVFCSIERLRQEQYQMVFVDRKISYQALRSIFFFNLYARKIFDFIYFPLLLIFFARKNQVNVVICRSSLAGALGLPVALLLGIPLIVESFEPHADYMVDSGVWNRNNIRTLLEKAFEKLQMRYARFLLPVSMRYEKKLIEEGVDSSRILMCPCTVSLNRFRFNPEERNDVRNRFQIQDKLVGIYVGKFGGIYYLDEAFHLFKQAFDFFGYDFFLIILSQDDPEVIWKQLKKNSVPMKSVKVLSVAHLEVPQYLSAADFAFSTIKPAPSRKFCSPIKTGEYWANGLPILTEDEIGDDTEIILKAGGGVILDREQLDLAFSKVQHLMKMGRTKLSKEIELLAAKYRNEERILQVYRVILHSIGNTVKRL